MSKDIEFIAINNMSRAEVVEILKISKVYIDFGNHPGKDRIPREAALLDCCIITNKRGSSLFYDDVSIDSEFQFEDEDSNIPLISGKIKECFYNYENKIKQFSFYKNKIKQEKSIFIEQIKNFLNCVM